MEGLVDYVKRQVKCPECRAEHRIPYNGIENFPANVTLQRFLEAHIEITGEAPDPHTGQLMERCAVCNEKNYLSVCAHCEKKICEGCKAAHSEVLKREIGRINNQVKRASHRLGEQLETVDKNITALKSNSKGVLEEIENISKRLQKAIRDREDFLKGEVQNQFNTEMRSMQMLHDGLELEISNVNSNIEVAEKHMDDDTPWEDGELMDTKDIFIKTMEFIRSFDYDTGGDYARRTRFMPPDDLNKLASSLSNMGELSLPNKANDPFSAAATFGTANLAKSKSDHRLTVQFKEQEETSPVVRRRFGDRPPPVESTNDNYDSEPSRRRFRSRFMKHEEEEETNVKPSEEKKHIRIKCIDTEDVSRGPLSGIVRILDSPRVIQRLQERDILIKRKKEEAKNPPPAPAPAPAAAATNAYTAPPRANRQISEDEIDKIKKQNKADDATSSSSTPATTTSSSYGAPPSTSPNLASTERYSTTTTATDYSTPTSTRASNVSSSTYDEDSSYRRTRPSDHTPSASNGNSSRGASRKNSIETAETTAHDKRFSRDNSQDSTLSGNLGSVSENGVAKSTRPARYTNGGSSRFTSRFLGRASTPSAENSRDAADDDDEDDDEEESSEETETEDSEESSEEEEDRGTRWSATGRNATPSSTNSTNRYRDTNGSSYSSRYGNSTDNSGTAASTSRYGSTNNDSSSSAYGRRSSIHEPKKDEDTYTGSKYLSRNRTEPKEEEPKSSFQSRFLSRSKSSAIIGPDAASHRDEEREKPVSFVRGAGRARFEQLAEKRQTLARSKSSAGLDEDESGVSDSKSSSTYKSKYSRDGESNAANRVLGSANSSTNKEENGTGNPQLSNWARYLKNKYGNKSENSTSGTSAASGVNRSGVNGSDASSSSASSAARALARSRSSHLLGMPKEGESTEDTSSKNADATPTSPAVVDTLVVPTHPIGGINRNQYLKKKSLLFQIGSRGSEPGTFTWPRGVAIGPDNTIVVADSSNHRVQVFNQNSKFIKEFGSYGSHYSEFDCLAGVAVNRIGQYIIADRYNHRIQVFDPSGMFLRSFGSRGSSDGKFSYPWGVATDALGFIYVCDKENHRIQVFQSDGTFVGKFGGLGSKPGQLEHPHYIAVSSTNKVIVSDSNNHRIQIFDINGKVQKTFGGEGAEEGKFKFPRGVAVDEQGVIVVADSGNNRMQVFSADGEFLRAFGRWGSDDGEFKGLEGVAVTQGGAIVVCDRENHRVQVF